MTLAIFDINVPARGLMAFKRKGSFFQWFFLAHSNNKNYVKATCKQTSHFWPTTSTQHCWIFSTCCFRLHTLLHVVVQSFKPAKILVTSKRTQHLRTKKCDRFQTSRKNFQQHATSCNRVFKRTQHVTYNNVRSCWPTMLCLFARGFKN